VIEIVLRKKPPATSPLAPADERRFHGFALDIKKADHSMLNRHSHALTTACKFLKIEALVEPCSILSLLRKTVQVAGKPL
jgi:hypothetical protein